MNLNQTQTPAQNPLEYKPVGRLLLSFSVPAIISCLINSIYNIVDQIFIGWGVGYLGNAATTVAFPIMTIVLAFATMIGSGGGAFAAIKLGEKEEGQAQRTLNNVVTLSIILGVAVMAAGLIFLDPVLKLFGAIPSVMPYAKDYTFVILLGIPFSILSVSLSNMARTDGSPRMSMYGVLIGAVLNTILDPIYIFVFHWGVTGAAIATVTSQIISTVVLLLYFVKRGHMRLNFKLMKPDGFTCKKISTLGISACITQLVACVMQVVMNNSLVYYGDKCEVGGDVALSAMGIVMKIAMILGAFGIGIGIGAQPIFGFNLGARRPHRIRKTYVLAAVSATALIALGWIACQTVPDLILQVFGGGKGQFMSFGVKCMRIYLFGIICAGIQIVSTNYFQATGQPLKAAILSSLRQLLLLVPLILILPLFFGLNGILYAGPIADISSAVIVILFIIFEMKKLNRWIKEYDAQQQEKENQEGAGGPLTAPTDTVQPERLIAGK